MFDLDAAHPIKNGTWLYAGTIVCEVKIVQHHTRYGSGDFLDPPEFANDLKVECFYVFYQTPVGKPKWVGGGCALSLAEAVSIVQQTLDSTLTWVR